MENDVQQLVSLCVQVLPARPVNFKMSLFRDRAWISTNSTAARLPDLSIRIGQDQTVLWYCGKLDNSEYH